MKGIFIRSANGLTADDDAAREMLHGIPIGSAVACEISRPRNLQHHRLYWSLCSAIADSIGANRENISDLIKIRSGHFVVVKTRSELMKFPRSISFAKMDQAEFSQFYNRACQVVSEEFLPHLTANEVRTQIEQMIGLPPSDDETVGGPA